MRPAATHRRPQALGLLLALLMVVTGQAQGAENLPTAPQGRVSDYASLLKPDQRQALEDQLTQYELSMRRPDGHGPQIAVALFPDLGGAPIEDLSIELAERWKIGSKADDGVLLVTGVKEHEVRIEVGYGVEERLPDAVAARIIHDLIVPRFRDGDFVGGLRAGVAGAHQALAGVQVTGQDEFTKGLAPLQVRPRQQDRRPSWGLFIGSGILLLLLLLFGGRGVRGFLVGMLFGSLFGRNRQGGVGGLGGGGFGGGGGSFGGGGATGKW